MMARGSECAGEMRYPALITAERNSCMGGGVALRHWLMEWMS